LDDGNIGGDVALCVEKNCTRGQEEKEVKEIKEISEAEDEQAD
jgi:hypothetical protein